MSAEWKRLNILWPADGSFPPHRPRDGDQAHKLAALIGSTFADDPRCSIPAGLFHTGKAGDATAGQGLSPIRYSANRRGMSVTAVGDDAVDVLAQAGHRLTRALSRQAGQPLQEQWAGGFVRWSAGRTLSRYKVHHFVFTRKPAKAFPELEADLLANNATPQVLALLEDRVRKGLQRQATALDLPELEADPLLQIESVEHLSGWNRGNGFYGLVAHDVVFQTDLSLMGPWHIGSLCLLGNGAVRRLDRR